MLKVLVKIKYFFIISFLSFNLYAFSSDSIYNLESELIDKDGKKCVLGDLSGKIQIFSMIYTRCKTVCPIIIGNMKALEKLLPEDLLDNVKFSLVSFDPDRDSVENLYKFFKEKRLNDKHWNLYKASNKDVLRLAVAVGIRFAKELNDEYTHSNLIIILDKNGVVRMHHQGLNRNYSELLKLLYTLNS